MSKADIIRKFLAENSLRSKKGIARILHEQHPKIFKSIEDARTSVRYVTGRTWDADKIKDPEKTKFFYNGFDKWSAQNLNIEEKQWNNPFVFPNFETLNVIADLHSVHLNHKALETFIKTTKDKTAVLVNGDLLDSESLSRHIKGNNVVPYETELEICHQILKGLKEEFTHVYFHSGNHDYWLERYLRLNAREVFKVKGLTLNELLRLNEIGVQYIPQLQYMIFADIDILHGHQFNSFGGGKFPSVSLLDRWQTFKKKYDVKVLCSHAHRYDTSISRKSKNGLFGQAWVTPAMCKKGAEYNPFAGWDIGWVVIKNINGITSIEPHLYDND